MGFVAYMNTPFFSSPWDIVFVLFVALVIFWCFVWRMEMVFRLPGGRLKRKAHENRMKRLYETSASRYSHRQKG